MIIAVALAAVFIIGQLISVPVLRAPAYQQMLEVNNGDFATEIEQAIQNTLDREVSTDRIGEMVMERIKPLDEVAYIRFASVYRRFQDVRSFIHEINKFLEEK